MTVQCCECKKMGSEKCPACGNPAHYILERVEVAPGRFEYQTPEQCSNPDCALVFKRGYGGVLNGLCIECSRNKMDPRTEVQVPKPASARDCRGCWHSDCGMCTAAPPTRDNCKEYWMNFNHSNS